MRFIFNQLRFSKNNAGHRPSESAVGDLGEAEAAEKDKVKLANLMSLAINFYPAHLQKKKKNHLWRFGTGEDRPAGAAGGVGWGGWRETEAEGAAEEFCGSSRQPRVSGANVGSECVTSLSVCSD